MNRKRDLKRTNIYLFIDQFNWMQQFAELRGVSVGVVVRDAVDLYMALKTGDIEKAASDPEVRLLLERLAPELFKLK